MDHKPSGKQEFTYDNPLRQRGIIVCSLTYVSGWNSFICRSPDYGVVVQRKKMSAAGLHEKC
ncbi:MAG: hypothetical protein KF851_05195 [Pirellulaceae bacterium]|nr:hypothetical protein [Pirellulaceae bacterium]